LYYNLTEFEIKKFPLNALYHNQNETNQKSLEVFMLTAYWYKISVEIKIDIVIGEYNVPTKQEIPYRFTHVLV
jgi:hypothetical protein